MSPQNGLHACPLYGISFPLAPLLRFHPSCPAAPPLAPHAAAGERCTIAEITRVRQEVFPARSSLRFPERTAVLSSDKAERPWAASASCPDDHIVRAHTKAQNSGVALGVFGGRLWSMLAW